MRQECVGYGNVIGGKLVALEEVEEDWVTRWVRRDVKEQSDCN